jgi:hypothetical protein
LAALSIRSSHSASDWNEFIQFITNLPDFKFNIYVTANSHIERIEQLRNLTEVPAQAKTVYDEFQSSYMKVLLDAQTKIMSLRKASIVGFDGPSEFEVEDKVEQIFRNFEQKTSDIRFNIVSLQNEAAAMTFWSVLPRKSRQKFQIAPSPHPISVPSLLVPFLSNLSYDRDCPALNYGISEVTQKIFPGRDVVFSRVPRSCPNYISQPFVKGYSLFDLMQDCNPKFGVFHKKFNVGIAYETRNISCILIQAHNCFLILTEASLTEGRVDLLNPSTDLTPNIFMDGCLAHYYGTATLFSGHVVLTFTVDDILLYAPRWCCYQRSAVEVWFFRGYSLFLIFDSPEICRSVISLLHPTTELPPWNSHYSASFSNELCKILENGNNPEPDILKTFTAPWKESKISTYLYLLILNFLASRSYSFHSQ